MIRSRMFRFKKLPMLVSVLLCACMLIGSLPISAVTADYDRAEYKQALMDKGFPADYADKLAELQLAHPNWIFEPLLVSETKPTYTFDYIIDKETRKPDINLIYVEAQYEPFYDPTNTTRYDNGHWRSPSRAAVEYFMDPRNFLNERDIFQFEDLGYHDRDYETGVEWIISGTFMEGTTLESGITMKDYIIDVGEELGVSPVHIAARIRQEQGIKGASDMISGLAGDRLLYYYENGIYKNEDGGLVNAPASGYTKEELLSYTGYYNYFNIGATGTGNFYLYLNGMKKAITGTADMEEEWDGDPSWNTREKSIYGGVYFLKTKYIDYYQNTLYLQKFCVDSRSPSPFSHQYMQNVGAALSEGRSSYKSYKEAGLLNSELTFLIPVYSGMPEQPCPDPSAGKSSYSPSDGIVTYITYSNFPYRSTKTYNAETVGECEAGIGEQIRVQGWSVHTYGTGVYEISIDGSEFREIKSYPLDYVQRDYADEYPLSVAVNAYQHFVDASALGAGEHTITVRAKTTVGSYNLVNVIRVNVIDVQGELDGDGAITSADLTMLLRYLAGFDVDFYGNSDVNGDERVNNRDMIELLNLLSAGNTTEE